MPQQTQSSQARTILVLLYLGYLLSFGDRVIFGLALKPIKATLHLSDSQLGLLSGVAFAASYALFSPLGGLLIDRVRRKLVMAGAVTFWSLATFATAFAGSFITLGLSRAGVGIGESLLHPLAVSLLGDTVPRERRPRAFAVYMSAGAVGSMAAMLLGGLLIQHLTKQGQMSLPVIGAIAPWQGLFMGAAMPGLLLAVVIIIVMREPRREIMPDTSADDLSEKRSGMAFLRANPRFGLALFAGISMAQMGAYTLTTWNILFFERVHGWTGAQSAIVLAATSGVATLVGCLLSGRLIVALKTRGHADAPLLVAIGAAILFATFGCLALAMPDPRLTVAVLPLAAFWGYVPSVAGFSAMGEALPAAIRARLAGLHTLANGLITNSLGPYLAGAFSDHLFPERHGLRWALMLTLVVAGVLGSILIAQGRPAYRRLVATL
jgi:MFS family permease